MPGAADIANFDGTSSKNVTVNVAANVSGISIGGGYGGTITQNAGIALTVGASGYNQGAGTFSGGTAAMTVNGPFTLTAGSFSPTAGTMSVSGNFTRSGGSFTAPAGTVSFGGGAATIDAGGPQTLNNVTFAAGAKAIAAGTTLTVGGGLTLTAGSLTGSGTVAAQGGLSQSAAYGGGTATLRIDGAGAQTFTGAATATTGNLPPLVIDKPSGTLSLIGTIRSANGWTYTAGTLDPTGSTVVFAGGTVSGSHDLGAVVIRGTTTLAGGTTLGVTAGLTLTSGNLNGTGVLAARGDVSQASTMGAGTASLRIDGAGAQTFTGAATTAAGNLPPLIIDKPAGTLSLAGTIRTASGWTYLAGTVDPGTSTVVFAGGTVTGSHALAAVDFRASTAIAAGTTLTVGGGLTLTAGSLTGSGTVAAQGGLSQSAAYGGGTATLRIDGAGAQTFTGAATATTGNLPPLVIDKPSGTLSLIGTIRSANGWTYTAGTLDPTGSTVVFAGGTVSGSHDLGAVVIRGTTTLAGGTTLGVTAGLTLTSGNLNGTGVLAARGDVSQASTMGAGTASLRIDGAGAQTFTGAATTAAGNLPPLIIDKPAGTLSLAGTIRTASGWTYLAGTVDPGTSTVVFAGGTVTGSHALAAVDFRASTAIAAGTTLTVGGGLTLTAGSLTGSGTVAAQGGLSQSAAYGGGTATLRIDGAGAQTFTGAATATTGNLPPLVIDKPSGTLSLIGTIRSANGWTYTAGTLDPTGSTVVFAGGTVSGSHDLGAVVIRGTTTLAGGTTLGVTAGLTLTSGNLNGTGVLAARGDVSQASTMGAGTASLRIDGAGAQTFTGAATTAAGNLPPLIIDKPAGTLSLAGTIRTASGWTYLAGTVDPGTSTVVFAGGTVSSAGMSFFDVIANGGTTTLGAGLSVLNDVTVTAGTLTTSASNHPVVVGGDLTISSTFRANGSTIHVRGKSQRDGHLGPRDEHVRVRRGGRADYRRGGGSDGVQPCSRRSCRRRPGHQPERDRRAHPCQRTAEYRDTHTDDPQRDRGGPDEPGRRRIFLDRGRRVGGGHLVYRQASRIWPASPSRIPMG